MAKVTIKELAKMLMEEKAVLATHPGAEENPDGIEKDLLSRSWGDDEEADPKLDYVDEARFAEIAGIIQEQPMMGGETSEAIDRELMDLSFKLEEEIDARMGMEDPKWLSNPSTVDAVIDMLDQIVARFTKRSEQGS